MQNTDLFRPLQSLQQEEWLGAVVERLSSGKEATVFCCEAGRKLGDHELVAAKVYRPPERRAFKRHMDYADGRYVQGRTARQAIRARNAHGRVVLFHKWIAFEHQVLGRCHRAGVRVPQPLRVEGYVVLMEYLGNRAGPAAQLRELDFSREEATEIVRLLVEEITRMLSCNLIHGDLSAYNVLHWQGEPWIIDVPQAVDPRSSKLAQQILLRDIRNLYRWGSSYGVPGDPDAIATELWELWTRAEL